MIIDDMVVLLPPLTDIDQANDNSGLIGAGIVGTFILVVSAWYIARLVGRRFGAKRAGRHIRQGLVRLCGSLS